MEYKSKSVFFGHGAAGHMQVQELIDYPGVKIIAEKENQDAEWKRKVIFNNKIYESISEAVKAWHDSHQKPEQK